jgi:zinc protease
MTRTSEARTKAASNGELPAIPAGVRVTTLDNGLTIIVREDHSAPVVSAQAWSKTGSIHEGKWLGAGMSHVLEHMLFKGTTTRGASRIDQEVQEAGGYMNAYTSFDRTVYHIDVPSTGARVAIDILCDIMRHATLPADEMAKEKQVILREMDMNQDDPGRRAGRRLFETAYTRSPYRHTVIGYPDIYNQLKAEDITGYYRERYAPNNVFYVIVGDVKAAEVVKQIRDSYADAKAMAMPPEVLPEEPRQTAPRETIEEAPIELGHVHISWHIPDIRHPDVPALDVLAAVLGNGRSSRLYQQVREKLALVHSVDAWTYNPGDAGLIGVSAMVDADKFTAAREAIFGEVEKIKGGKVQAREVAKAVKRFVAGTLAVQKTMQGQAGDLGGSWLAANDLNFSHRFLEAVKRVTRADLRRVALEYLTPANRTVYALLPQGAAPKAEAAPSEAAEHSIRKFELKNGLRLLVKEDHRLPFVQFRAVLQGGVLAETSTNSGLTHLMAKMLIKGTARRTAEEIARQIESVGGSIDSIAGYNTFGVSVEVMSDDLSLGLNLVADVLLNPSFPKPPLDREREVQLAGIKAQKDQLLRSAGLAMRRALFGDRGYGLDVLGSEESVGRLSVAELRVIHKRLAVPANCVLAIFGDVQPAKIKASVEKAFAKWRSGPKPELDGEPLAPLREVRRVSETRDKKQAVLVVGFPGASIHDSDRYALELLREACSDLGSRLFLRIRESLGLAYYVGAQNFIGLAPGYVSFYAGTEPAKAKQVEQELLREAELLRAEGLTAEELNRAKAKTVGQRKIARQDLGNHAMSTALDELYGLGYAHGDAEDALYEAVTLDQIKAVAQKYLTADAMVISSIIGEPEND